MTPKTSPILWWPPKNIHKIFIPLSIFLKTKKNMEIQNFDPQKIAWAYICMKILEYPPWADNLLQTYCTQIRPNILLRLIWIQTV